MTYASTSWDRIISLKSTLAKTKKDNHTITEYLAEMTALAEALALAQSPIIEEDLVINILNGLSSEYKDLTSAIHVRPTALPLAELQRILLDHEDRNQNLDTVDSPLIPTTNATMIERSGPPNSDRRSSYSSDRRPSHSRRGHGGFQYTTARQSAPLVICRFCDNAGHDVKVCRKLQRFLRDNQIPHPAAHVNPVANHVAAKSFPGPQQWMFDSGASHHIASDATMLPQYSDYGGPDEVCLGDGSGHGGASSSRGERP
ncbi:unnamed protein product [Cuscuta europaea]|uniref:Uncharacterized protein n=1 Tax=Cuscuta europaea TaxID=41803 RepID=A0A9P0Z7P6_CUSEU|nr:unnamed protein product [Cuscuta europaea]